MVSPKRTSKKAKLEAPRVKGWSHGPPGWEHRRDVQRHKAATSGQSQRSEAQYSESRWYGTRIIKPAQRGDPLIPAQKRNDTRMTD